MISAIANRAIPATYAKMMVILMPFIPNLPMNRTLVPMARASDIRFPVNAILNFLNTMSISERNAMDALHAIVKTVGMSRYV